MGVFISDDELNTFKQNGVSEDQIQDTITQYRNEGVSDDEIRSKIDTKLSGFGTPANPASQPKPLEPVIATERPKQTQQSIPSDPSERFKHLNDTDPKFKEMTQEQKEQYIIDTNPEKESTKVLTGKVEQKRIQNWDKNGRVYYTDEKGNRLNIDSGLNWFQKQGRNLQAWAANFEDYLNATDGDLYNKKIGDVVSALSLFIPAFKAVPAINNPIAKGAANWAANGAVGGAVEGAAENIREGKPFYDPANIAKGAGVGTIFGGGLGAGYSGIMQGVKNRAKNKAAQIAAEATLASKPAQEAVENVAAKTPAKKVSIGAEIPDNIVNLPEKELPTQFINENQLSKEQKAIQEEIGNLKAPETKKTYVTRRYKNRFWKENVDDPLTKGLIDADTELNSILDEIKKNPDIINDTAKIQELENRLNEKVNFPDDELNSTYWKKFYDAIEKVGNYDKVNKDFNISEKLRMSGDLKKSKLPQSADLPEDLQAGINEIAPEYMVLHNKDLTAKSQKLVNENADVLRSDLLSRAAKEDTNLEALDFENARQLLSKLYQEGKIDEALDLTELISQKGSKAGQAVQSMSLWAKTTPEGAVRQAQRLIAKYNKNSKKQLPKLTTEQAQDIMDLAINIHKQTDDRARDVATAQLLKYQSDLIPVNGWQKAKTLRNISLLLNPKTIGRNIFGNGIFNGVDSLSKNLAAGIDGIASKFTGKSTRAFTPIESTKATMKGMWKGSKEGFEDALKGIDTRNGIGGRFDLPSQRSFKDPVFGTLETALDLGLRVPDRAFYQGLFEESVVNQLKAQGLKEATPEILEQARKEALEGVFQNDSAISQAVLGVRNSLNKATNWISPNSKTFGLGDMVIPYAQTPANIVQQGINYSPAGFMKAVINGVKGDQRQATLDAARGIIGTGIMGAGYAGAKSRFLNGDYEDYNVRKNLETTNDRPFQFNLPNGFGVSYSQLQPASIPLSAGTALAQPDKEKAIQSAIGTVTELPMLDSMGKLIRDSQNYGIGTGVTNLMMNIPSQFIPTGVNQINSYVDPVQRETYDPNPIMRGVKQGLNKIPLASKTLPEKHNVKGEAIPKYESEGIGKAFDVFINPVFVNKKKDDLVMNEVKALYEITGEKDSLLAVPERKIKIDGETKELSGKEYSEYSKVLGELSYKGYKQIMDTQRYKNADDKTRLKLLGKVKENAKAIAQEELFNKVNKNDPRNAIDRKINNRINRGQRKIDRIMNKMDSNLIDSIMYEEE